MNTSEKGSLIFLKWCVVKYQFRIAATNIWNSLSNTTLKINGILQYIPLFFTVRYSHYLGELVNVVSSMPVK